MIRRQLPYRFQIPLGLSLAVLIGAIFVTVVTAKVQSENARKDTLSLLDRAMVLVTAQVRPMLTADDTWRTFSLLKDVDALLPGASMGHTRLAVLSVEGAVFAASSPAQLGTGHKVLGQHWHRADIPSAQSIPQRVQLNPPDGSLIWIEPIRSEDAQTMGFVLAEVDAEVFRTNWGALLQTAFLGIVLAVALLVPIGWWVGRRMAKPVGKLVQVIEEIGAKDPSELRAKIPRTSAPELARIGHAISQLMAELEHRQQVEKRALAAERLAVVGRMTAAVAHEINNPLAGLLTATQTLRLHGNTDEVRGRTVDLLDRGLQQIRTTVAALLPQARLDDRTLDINDLDDVVTLARSIASKLDIEISTSLDVHSAIRVSSAPLRQVMLNLLLNAVKAAGEKGHISATLEVKFEKVCFCVKNTGQVLTQDAFHRLLATESGDDPRGYGLWVCRQISNHLGGSFESSNTESEQTYLMFSVPNQPAREQKE